MDVDPAGVTSYGPGVGYQPLRAWLADRHGVEIDQVLLTDGSQRAANLLYDDILTVADDVVVEKPCPRPTLSNLLRRSIKIFQVPVDDDGLDVAELRQLLESGVRPRLVRVVPSFQDPTGVTLTTSRRHELIGLAREYNFAIFEDDPFVDIRFRGEEPPTLLSLDDPDSPVVVRSGSFSQTVCPGVRVGFLIGPAATVTALTRRAVNTYLSPNMFSSPVTKASTSFAPGTQRRTISQEAAMTLGVGTSCAPRRTRSSTALRLL